MRRAVDFISSWRARIWTGSAPVPEDSRHTGSTVLTYTASIVVAFVIAAMLVALAGSSPWDTLVAMYRGSVATPSAWGLSIDNATPLLVVATGTIIAGRAGFFNLGQEGQVMIGAVVFTAVAIYVPGPSFLILILSLIGGVVGGALWAGIGALLYFWRNIPVVISTLLLVYIAGQVVPFVVTEPWLLAASDAGAVVTPQSDTIPAGVWISDIGRYPGLKFSSAALIALILAIAVAVILRHTTWGFRIRMLGLNRRAAQRVGVSTRVYGTLALLLSGGFAGLAGSMLVGSGLHQLDPSVSQNNGWNGLLVALIARENPLVAVPAALFFGLLEAGGGFLASTGVPRYLVDVVTSMFVLAVVFPSAWQIYRRARRPRESSSIAMKNLQGVSA